MKPINYRKIKNLIFDLDGTICDSGRGIINGARYALSCFGIDEPSDQNLQRVIGPPLKWALEEYYHIPPEQSLEAVKRYREFYLETGIYQNAVYPGIEDLLKSLKECGYRLFIATAKPENMAHIVLDDCGLTKYFDFVAGALMDETRTDKKDILLHLLENRPELNIDQCLMIGDRRYDMIGASSLDMSRAGVRWGYGSEQELLEAGAQELLDSPKDLLHLLSNNNALFISVEGPDGVGKTTQIKLLVEWLQSKNLNVFLSREPGGTQIGEEIREILLKRREEKVNPVAEALLFSASRAQYVQDVLKPALDQYDIVISDRYVDSSVAYQGSGRELGEALVVDINRPVLDMLMPDLTVMILLPPDQSIVRLNTKLEDMDRLEAEDMAFWQRVYQGFEALAQKYPERIARVDAVGSKEDTAGKIRDVVSRYIKEAEG